MEDSEKSENSGGEVGEKLDQKETYLRDSAPVWTCYVVSIYQEYLCSVSLLVS